jgi:predicted nucleic acid-binding protein
MATYTVVYDACVLYPAPLRDLLMNLAVTRLFRARWTMMIHDEWIRSLEAKGLDRRRLDRTRELMDRAVPDCLIAGYEQLISTLDLPDPDDRHVLAAAIAGRADAIITFNLRHFPAGNLAPHGIEVQHPDDFVVRQMDLNFEVVLEAVRRQRANLKRPPLEVDRFLDILDAQQLSKTVERLRAYSKTL